MTSTQNLTQTSDTISLADEDDLFYQIPAPALRALLRIAEKALTGSNTKKHEQVGNAVPPLPRGRGGPFSANEARQIHGVTGGVVGAAFNALRTAGVIRAIGDDTSTKKSTHGHRIMRWTGVAAA